MFYYEDIDKGLFTPGEVAIARLKYLSDVLDVKPQLMDMDSFDFEQWVNKLKHDFFMDCTENLEYCLDLEAIETNISDFMGTDITIYMKANKTPLFDKCIYTDNGYAYSRLKSFIAMHSSISDIPSFSDRFDSFWRYQKSFISNIAKEYGCKLRGHSLVLSFSGFEWFADDRELMINLLIRCICRVEWFCLSSFGDFLVDSSLLSVHDTFDITDLLDN